MFQVLIVDDESSVTQSLVYSIPWGDLGLRVAGTASDGAAALEIAQAERIDIAILDIRMPGINGLELCERLRQMNEEVQLIIASGYAEFAYAEKAIQYGVLGYCLKPLDYTQMTRILRKAVQNLRKNRHMAGQDDLIEALERRDGDELQTYLTQLGFSQDDYFIAVSIGEKKLDKLDNHGISLRFGRGQWGYIMKTNPAGWLEGKTPPLHGCLGVGYMRQAVSGEDLFEAFEECTARAFQYFICEDSRICGSLDEHRARHHLNRVLERVKANDWEEIDIILQKLSRSGWEDFTARNALRLCNLIFSSDTSYEGEEYYYIFNLEQMVNTYGNFQEMLRQLREFLQENLFGAKGGRAFTNVTFMKLMKYVNDHYRGEISLSSAAQALNMNSNYVSQLFKRGAGVTFVHYITQKRLEDAKELLTATQKPLTDIALEVGFSDTFYFVKTFKKFIGMTPGQYRLSH